MKRRVPRAALRIVAGVFAVTGVVAAHGGGLRGAAPDRLAVPTWLFLSTGGAVVGVSFLLASLVTDRNFVASLHRPLRRWSVPTHPLAGAGRVVGVAALVLVLVTGVTGPEVALRNPAVLVVWVGWWAGVAMVAYLAVNPWPAVDPFRTVARAVPAPARVDVSPNRGAWLSAVGLLALFGVEVVSPLSSDGDLLAVAVAGYLAVTLAGVAVVGRDTWFGHVDPVSRAFRLYGAVAPLHRTDDGVTVRLPAAGLTDDLLPGSGGVAFVVALVWGTTYDGLVSTPLWADVARAVVAAGVPPRVLYLGVLAAGFVGFYLAFRTAVATSRRTAPTYVVTETLARRFAPSLVAIAAGYHLAHNLTYFLALAPLLADAVASPLAPPLASPATLPGWVRVVPIAAVLLGHLLAVGVAHAASFDLLPGRLQAIRSQYPLTVVMVLYTMTSLWIVSQPSVTPPFL